LKTHKIDTKQTAIVTGLRKVGCEVISLAMVHNGCPDLLVNKAGNLTMLEVKDSAKSKLTPHQEYFHQRWPVHVVTNLDEAIAAVWFT